MAVHSWIASHANGWPVFLAATVLLSVGAASARARRHPGQVKWWFLGTWWAAVFALSVDFGINRLRGYAPHLWSAQVGALALATALPLLLVLLVLALWMRGSRTQAWQSGASLSTVIGMAAMTAAPMLSTWMFHALHSWMALDHPGG